MQNPAKDFAITTKKISLRCLRGLKKPPLGPNLMNLSKVAELNTAFLYSTLRFKRICFGDSRFKPALGNYATSPINKVWFLGVGGGWGGEGNCAPN